MYRYTRKNRQLTSIAIVGMVESEGYTMCPRLTPLALMYLGISATSRNLLNSNISSTCSHSMVNVDPLTAEIGLPVWGTPANFNGFRVLTSLLQRRRSMEVNQNVHDVWPSPGLVHYTFFGGEGGSCPLAELCQVHYSLCVQVLRYHILAALPHGSQMCVCVSQTSRRGIFTRQGGHPVRHWAVELYSYTH